jgi:hypothetical protein
MKAKSKILLWIIGLFFICFIIIIAYFLPGHSNEIINLGLVMATVALAIIAYNQLNALREQANADFLLKFNRDFFNNEITKKIIPLFEENKPLLNENGGVLSEYDLDDFLGYYELMSWYEEIGIIDFGLLDETFGHYISMAWQNKEIKKYIEGLRESTKDPRYYKPFENLASRIIDIEKGLREKVN